MTSQANVVERKKSILSEIINQLSLTDRYLVQQYLNKENMNIEERERIRNLELAMNREHFHWWKSPHPQERAYRQFLCSTLIMNFDIYKQDMQRLLGRHVYEYELFNREEIMEEVNTKYYTWLKNHLANK